MPLCSISEGGCCVLQEVLSQLRHLHLSPHGHPHQLRQVQSLTYSIFFHQQEASWQDTLCLSMEDSAISLHHSLLCSKVWMGCVDCLTCMSRHCICCLLHVVGCLSAVQTHQARLLLHCACAPTMHHYGALNADAALCACCTCVICRASECCDEPTASKSSLSTMLQMPPSLCPSYAFISCEFACACVLLASCWN